MKLVKQLLCVLSATLLLSSCGENDNWTFAPNQDVDIQDGERIDNEKNPFDFDGLYTDPELKIDGVREPEYDKANGGSGRYTVYEGGTETTYVSLYKGEKGIYFLFECQDDDISVITVEDTNICTAQSDSVELYFDAYASGGRSRGANQYEFRVTAASRIYSYLNGFVAKVFTYGTINNHKDVDNGWAVEGYVAYKTISPDYNKSVASSFAFARVTKTGSTGYRWNGNVDPQIPDNYSILHTDNNLYPINECPVSGKISGRLVNTIGQPISGAKIEASGLKTTYTNESGEYELNIVDAKEDINVSFSKKNYLSYTKVYPKKELRSAKNQMLDAGDSVFLSETEKDYQTTISGKVFERDGVTPISGATVSVNDSSSITGADGKYSFVANCSGYENSIIYGDNSHLTYTKNLDFLSININQTTDINDVQLDESAGDQIGFGNVTVGYATARAVREADGIRLVLKTEDVMSMDGSNFEVFIDTKESTKFNGRNGTDYLFNLKYADEGVGDITNYGGKTVRAEGIETTYGRLNEQYFVEALIPYGKIEVTADEVVGFYFGIKYNWNWAGMYENGNGNYIKAEATINYVRLGLDSKFFIGSCNNEPVMSGSYKTIGKIGEFTGKETIVYDASYNRCEDYLMLKFVNNTSIPLNAYAYSINLYVDMNYLTEKTHCDSKCSHIAIYPGRPVSHYSKYTDAGTELPVNDYEENADETWTYLYNNTIYVKLAYSIFGGSKGSNIGFAVGMWVDHLGGNSFLTWNGHENAEFNNPSTYMFVDAGGSISQR